MPIDPTQLAALSAILRLGSFDAADSSLNVTPSAISQRLKALEEQVGAALVNRSQPCTATPLGARLAKRGAVSAAVTGQHRAVTGCDLHPLGIQRYIATASPVFMRHYFADGVTAQSLARAPMLTFNPKDQLQTRWITAKTGATLHPPSHQMPSTHAFVDAALQGMAWGMNPETLVRGHLASGRLIALDSALPMDVPLYWQVTRVMAPALAPLTSAILGAAKEHLRHPS